MSMRQDIYDELLPRLIADYGFKDKGQWLQEGRCPACEKREFYTHKENPWKVKCGRSNKCGREYSVKELYPEIFDHWSNRYKPTPESPNAAADAYLVHSRRLNLMGLRGCYTQELYKDYNKDITSATIRFPLPNGAYWERLLDQPSRFDRKAYFKKGTSYSGHVWLCPDQGYEQLARSNRIWITEGIFDALSWRQVGEFAVSAMSTNNYPALFLDQLRKTCADLDVRPPELIFAFDTGKAGTEFTIKYVEMARKKGWEATAAQPVAEGEKCDHDWNDLLGRDLLGERHIKDYLWNGKILLAKSASEKALLLWKKQEDEKKRPASFFFTYDSRTWWGGIDPAKVEEISKKDDVSKSYAAEACLELHCISNCAFRVLYKQTDTATLESHYFLSIDLPGRDKTYKGAFLPAAIVSGSEFKKTLMGAAPGALWEGSTRQLDRIISHHTKDIKEVETIDFTGYSKEHGAYILGDIAVHKGKVLRVNSEDYFDLGSTQVKLRSRTRILKHVYDAENFDTSWLEPMFAAWAGNGLAALSFWVMSFFAEQIRSEQQAMGYFEMWGPANTGKSTIVKFLWRMAGRVQENYEGIDPSKSTMVGYLRTLSQVANLPVIFVESDREEEGPHIKKYDWSEIKSLFDGTIGRATGRKSQSNDTNEPIFRGALLIEQNAEVQSGEPILSRIMSTKWTKDNWSSRTKAAAEQIAKWPRDKLSGTMIHIIRREAAYMKAFNEAIPKYESLLIKAGVGHDRVRKCHAQLHAGLDALCALIDIPDNMMLVGHEHITDMARARADRIGDDHPYVKKFWEWFDFLQETAKKLNADGSLAGLNHHRQPDRIALKPLEVEQAVKRANLQMTFTIDDVKKHLKACKSRPFVEVGTVNSALTDKSEHCWVFRTTPLLKKGS
ncbi:toprim domain-containing protein [Asticcacaulis endophyticus]|uniref:Toprim-like n=1 Tax=Asticcacaulis endophyticus TaxID=1395890 RepID=A0A918Q4V6_9CAUL|nr:toprim domain-containing protein [Asticcacaulis endophyticus]GGZ31852.1 hypothetical protein GCM10011273_17320 [Asticcacaulis endophyticus]